MIETQILVGTKVAQAIKKEVSQELEQLKKSRLVPGLAAILVGDNPASQVYIRNKIRTCTELEMHSETINLSEKTKTNQLIEVIQGLNERQEIDGILVQLPLPDHVDEKTVLSAVHPNKDVDGFHPQNVAKLCAGIPTLAPATPMGIMELLRREGIPLEGREAIVVGRLWRDVCRCAVK